MTEDKEFVGEVQASILKNLIYGDTHGETYVEAKGKEGTLNLNRKTGSFETRIGGKLIKGQVVIRIDSTEEAEEE